MNTVDYISKVSLHPKFFNARSLIHDKEGPERFSSWDAGGYRRLCSFTDVDHEISHDGEVSGVIAELGDQAEGRRRYLRIEFKPTKEVSPGQIRHLKDVADAEKVTQVIAVIPDTEHPLSVGNAGYICSPHAKASWALVDYEFGLEDFVDETLVEFNKRKLHVHYGKNWTDDVVSCFCESCSIFGPDEIVEWQRRHEASVHPDAVHHAQKQHIYKAVRKFSGNKELMKELARYGQSFSG